MTYLVRQATEADLDLIAGFEVEIALISFGDEAITDTGLHRKRVSGALGKPGEITLVAAAEAAPGRPLPHPPHLSIQHLQPSRHTPAPPTCATQHRESSATSPPMGLKQASTSEPTVLQS